MWKQNKTKKKPPDAGPSDFKTANHIIFPSFRVWSSGTRGEHTRAPADVDAFPVCVFHVRFRREINSTETNRS